MRRIPNRIAVGFKSTDSKLSYVTYYNETGKLAQRVAFDDWRSSTLPIVDYDNLEMRTIRVLGWSGGVENSYSYNVRKTYIRVRDCRDFEFEVTVDNFLNALKYSSKLSETNMLNLKYYIGWEGTQVCIAPVDDPDWDNVLKVKEDHELISKVSQLKPGTWYSMCDGSKVLYIGRYKKIKQSLRHRYPVSRFSMIAPIALNLTNFLKGVKRIQSDIIPQKYPDFQDVIIGDQDTKYTYYFYIQGEIREYKGVPSGLYFVPSLELSLEDDEIRSKVTKELSYLENPIIKVEDSRFMRKIDFRNKLKVDCPARFLSVNFNNEVVTLTNQANKIWILEVPTSIELPDYGTGKAESSARLVINMGEITVEQLYAIINPAEIDFILEDGSTLNGEFTDHIFGNVKPDYS